MNDSTAAPNEVETPIINSPFAEPRYHWQIERGKPPVKAEGRRPASYFYRVPDSATRGRKTKAQLSLKGDRRLEDGLDLGQQEEFHRVTWIRLRLAAWRAAGYPGASGVTRELLDLWHAGTDRRGQRLFFAQIEAAETIIFLVEAAEAFKKGMPPIPLDKPGAQAKAAGFRAFQRFACKMATGTGKTTVMGMLAAWSILNRIAEPTDDRFSDTVLAVCPNVTIRERLKELDPALGDLSIYRTRQLVPPQRMEELRRGEVMIANWHRLAKQESNAVNGDSARVVKTGEAVQVVKNAGKSNEATDTRYFESDKAWMKRIRQELGSGRGRCPHWLIFNDEAHHAYRRGDAPDTVSLDPTEDEDRGTLAKKNAKEATIWIEGLDRINKLAGGDKRKGIRLCVDLSATPFYIQGSGNEVGKPLPWIVSDFGLLDAIESGLVKVPQLPTRDITGAAEASYFNVWRWVQYRAEQDGHATALTPALVMTYATAPINQLAQDWHKRFLEWQEGAKGELHPVPPVFIVVCRDTRVAGAVYDWLADGKGAADAPPWFRNQRGQEVTVRIDSRVVEDMEEGGTKDETRRLRFILDTVGKKTWPGGKVPEDWSNLVRKHNEKAAGEDDGAVDDGVTDGRTLGWIDERVPPGRDIRCIISVSMLAEGWDANTVTHIVGLRPFGSQLLCEQVIGRALRRLRYAVNEETGLFAEETAKVFGVPFELVPFKVRPINGKPPPPPPTHIFSVPEKSEFEIEFPIVEGYFSPGAVSFHLDWAAVPTLTIDPLEIPDQVQLNSLTSPTGALSAYGPGEKPLITLKEWRQQFRVQQVAFRLAREVVRRWQGEQSATGEGNEHALPAQTLFPHVASAARRFLSDPTKLICMGSSEGVDVLLVNKYAQAAVDNLFEALRRGTRPLGQGEQAELPRIPNGSAGRGSTRCVDFHTTKPIYPADKCHLNAMAADTKQWEQIAAFALDAHSSVVRWVKNEHLGLRVPYRKHGVPASYLPDFIAVLLSGLILLIEIKGQYGDDADLKAKAAQRWVEAVNRAGGFGTWAYRVVTDPPALGKLLDELSGVRP
ncbi:BPTD_3080 family restriction endonuclease [Lamprocystis purpurea]|uniref:BPTD_3080 family restriction endonuclease n=1 Tax=Lamprocystis purpurea TaxID=61598 RepID=UPI00036293A9|nr:DEAD/DEAH box helicase family protein [Lamprocystis purpurea]